MAKKIELLGSHLEGGGQLVRLSLGLAALTQKSIKITQIRGNRSGGGGLKQQHLKAAEWLGLAAEAEMTGLEKGSKTLGFDPGIISSSSASFKRMTAQDRLKKLKIIDIGSPGSVGLVIQAILPYLVFCGNSLKQPGHDTVDIEIHGATNVSFSPSVQYLEHVFCPMLQKIGLPVSIHYHQPGWSTGKNNKLGKVVLTVTPLASGNHLPAVELCDRGKVVKIEAYIVVPNEYQRSFIQTVESEVKDKKTEIGLKDNKGLITIASNSEQPKRFYLLMIATSDTGVKLGRDWLYDEKVKPGDQTIPAKMVKKVLKDLIQEIKHCGCVDEHLRDQLVVFQALAKGESKVFPGLQKDRVTEMEPSLHTKTTHWVAKQLLDVDFDSRGNCVGMAMAAL